jgi:glutaminyl-peptide cyclotransferase
MSYEGEGWGLAAAGDRLIMSNGTGTLAWRDPADFSVTRLLDVTLDGSPVGFINELELVGGTLYANLWTSSLIAAIDTASGEVLALYSAEGLLSPEELSAADVLNGIAFEPSTGRLLVTGKLWPRAFLVDPEGER